MEAERKTRVGLIFGGRSGEHEVSLMSAQSVLAALDQEKYEITQIGITHSGEWLVGENILDLMIRGETRDLTRVTLFPDPTRNGIYAIRKMTAGEALEHFMGLDVLFPLLHGTFGEDGTLQGLFEMAGIAYVGAGVLGSSLGMDKGVFRDTLRAYHIPVVETLVVTRAEIYSHVDEVISKAERLAAYPLFIKPANLGSSVGVTKCHHRSDVLEGLIEAARFDRRILVERGVNARELEVSILGNDDPEASVVGEIRPAAEFYSYEAKYHDDRSELLIPAPILPEIAERVRQLAVQAYKAVDCAGMARVDFFLDKDSGELYLNELNTIPGFTRISMYPKLWDASGLPYPQLIDRLIELAFERHNERKRTEWRYYRQ